MKQIILIFFIIIIYLFIGNLFTEKVIIPNESIRLRIIGNSNNENDQELKQKISEEVQKELYGLLKDSKNIEEARTIIKNNINSIKSKINKYINENEYSILFGENYFPEKIYNGVIYEEGFYESLLVKLGKASGNNWWCVLFPPLCLMEAEETEEYEYKLYVKEIIDKYF